MRLLTFSDLHGSLPAAEAMVHRGGAVDLVIAAGDIGPPTAPVLDLVAGLGAPVFYVYGNWDFEYEPPTSCKCVHLQDRTVRHGDFLFVGYSGCHDQWGENPILAALLEEVRAQHATLLGDLGSAVTRDNSIEDADRRRWLVRARRVAGLARTDVRRLKVESALTAFLHPTRNADAVRRTAAYARYREDVARAYRNCEALNFADVRSRAKASGHDPRLTVFVSHERIYRLHERWPGVGLHLYGHRHGHTVSRRAGTTFVNVSALDPWAGCTPGYTIIETSPGGEFHVTFHALTRASELRVKSRRYVREHRRPTSVPLHRRDVPHLRRPAF